MIEAGRHLNAGDRFRDTIPRGVADGFMHHPRQTALVVHRVQKGQRREGFITSYFLSAAH